MNPARSSGERREFLEAIALSMGGGRFSMGGQIAVPALCLSTCAA
jgi:hypothetical protein